MVKFRGGRCRGGNRGGGGGRGGRSGRGEPDPYGFPIFDEDTIATFNKHLTLHPS